METFLEVVREILKGIVREIAANVCQKRFRSLENHRRKQGEFSEKQIIFFDNHHHDGGSSGEKYFRTSLLYLYSLYIKILGYLDFQNTVSIRKPFLIY